MFRKRNKSRKTKKSTKVFSILNSSNGQNSEGVDSKQANGSLENARNGNGSDIIQESDFSGEDNSPINDNDSAILSMGNSNPKTTRRTNLFAFTKQGGDNKNNVKEIQKQIDHSNEMDSTQGNNTLNLSEYRESYSLDLDEMRQENQLNFEKSVIFQKNKIQEFENQIVDSIQPQQKPSNFSISTTRDNIFGKLDNNSGMRTHKDGINTFRRPIVSNTPNKNKKEKIVYQTLDFNSSMVQEGLNPTASPSLIDNGSNIGLSTMESRLEDLRKSKEGKLLSIPLLTFYSAKKP